MEIEGEKIERYQKHIGDYLLLSLRLGASLVGQIVKKICLQYRRPGFNPWVEKIPWWRARQPTPVFLPRESSWTEEPGRL